MANKSIPVKSPVSDLADILIEDLAEQNRRKAYDIEQALVKAGRKTKVEFDLDNPFNRPRESKLFFSLRGNIKYISVSGNSYETKLQQNSQMYKLLHIFVANPKQLFTEDDLATKINSDQNSIRNIVTDLRKKLGLNSNNEDNFLISNKKKRYGINCICELRD